MRGTTFAAILALGGVAAAPAAADETARWAGSFVSGSSRIEISAAPDSTGLLRATGRSCTACGEAREHVGRFDILGRPSGAVMLLVETESGAFSAEAPSTAEALCVLAAKRSGDRLEVLSNEGCGGAGVSFDGIYVREAR